MLMESVTQFQKIITSFTHFRFEDLLLPAFWLPSEFGVTRFFPGYLNTKDFFGDIFFH